MCMQNLRRALLGLSVATLVVVGTAVGGPFEDGVAAYQRGDYAIALQSYRKALTQRINSRRRLDMDHQRCRKYMLRRFR